MDIETRLQIKRMCDIILGNPRTNKELDSLAFYVGHHPSILNAENEAHSLTDGQADSTHGLPLR
jgi:hypothetical protein